MHDKLRVREKDVPYMTLDWKRAEIVTQVCKKVHAKAYRRKSPVEKQIEKLSHQTKTAERTLEG